MGIFSKKNKGEAPKEKKKKSKGNKPKKYTMTLASVVDESVTESAMDIAFSNRSFMFDKDGEVVSAAILLDVEQIGGLSKKSKGEDKGSMVVAIRSGRMATYITAELLEEEKIIFIPNQVTMTAMEEYGLLTDATYKWVFLRDNGDIEYTDTDVDYYTVEDIANGSKDLLVALGLQEETLDDGFGGHDLANTVSDTYYDKSFSELHETIEDDSQFEKPVALGKKPVEEEFEPVEEVVEPVDFEESFDMGFNEPVEEVTSVNQIDANPIIDDFSNVEIIPEEHLQNDSDMIEEVVTLSEVNKAVDDVTLVNDIGLKVSLEPFDAHYSLVDDFHYFDDARGEGWLDEQLNHMSKQANSDMARLKESNHEMLKRVYLKEVSKAAVEVTRDAINKYKETLDNLDHEKALEMDEIKGHSRGELRTLKEKFEADAEAYGEAAKNNAIQKYKERHQKAHEYELNTLMNQEINKLELEIANKKNRVYEERREFAQNALSDKVNEILDTVNTLYNDNEIAENDLFNEWKTKLNDYLDTYRKDEIARTELLAKDLAENDRAEQAKRLCQEEHRRELDRYENDIKVLNDKIAYLNDDMERELIKKDSSWKATVEDLEKKNNDLQTTIDNLFNKYENLSEAKDKEYKTKIDILTNESREWSSKFESAIHMSKKMNAAIGVACLIAMTTCAALGFILGSNHNSSDATKVSSQPQQSSPYVINVQPQPVQQSAPAQAPAPAPAPTDNK